MTIQYGLGGDPDTFEKWLSRQTMSDSLRLVWSDAMRRVFEVSWNELHALETAFDLPDIDSILDNMWKAACSG